MAPEPGAAVSMFTWRKALGGGVLAFALWGVVAAGWVLLKGSPPGGPTPVSAQEDLAAIAARADDASLPAVAVLPFQDMGSDDEHAYFADGVHEDILTNLSKARGLLVMSRTSMQKYRDTNLSIREIAAELGATAVVEGSVRRVGNQVRITAQLIDAESDSHLWAESYDRTLDNVFAVQSEIALAVAGELEAALTPEEVARIESAPTAVVTAHDHYLQGRQEYQRLEELERPVVTRFPWMLSNEKGMLLARLGRLDEAIDQLEQSFEEHNDVFPFWETEPRYAPLRSHPRFQALLARVKAKWEEERAQVLEDEKQRLVA